jgi:hypothetical protein
MFSVTAAAANFDRRGYWERVGVIKQAQGQAC